MELRPELKQFAEDMETELKKNDHKGGWRDCGIRFLLARLREEVEELEKAVGVPCSCCGHFREPETWRDIVSEAADVANFAMMIADITRGKLKEAD